MRPLLAKSLQVTNLVEKEIPYSRGVGNKVDLDNVPYSLSEDFVSSYRMHPLLPDLYLIDGDAARQPPCPFCP